MIFELPSRSFQQKHIDLKMSHIVNELGDLCHLLAVSEPENRWFYKELCPLYDKIRWAKTDFNLHDYFVYQSFRYWAERADAA